ncbi:hypothetical protein XELAEV_18004210mg [Xenopus laevis]|uniref:Uncharacterized protein n=1 Tax=Xenopus laevis TaxID=8355 RepID=A0A974BRG8_XENLA|nr:hypothetical protein XELAEV_18004210mg [Xenopus laevis]
MPVWLHLHLHSMNSPAPKEVNVCMAPPLSSFYSLNSPTPQEVHACMAPPLPLSLSWNCPCAPNSTDF